MPPNEKPKVKPRFDNKGDGWANSHREILGRDLICNRWAIFIMCCRTQSCKGKPARATCPGLDLRLPVPEEH